MKTAFYCGLISCAFAGATACSRGHAQHIGGWITVNNDAVLTTPAGTGANTITEAATTTTINGVEGYQALAAFPTITLADGEYVELSGKYDVLGRTASAGLDLQRLRDQIRIGLFRAPEGDPLQAANLTGYIIEHRSEVREIRTPVGAPATNQAPFVSARSSALGAGLNGFSTAADPAFGSGTGNLNYTESDLVAGENVSLTITYRIARQGNLLDITGSIAGTPAVINQSQSTPPGPGDGVFLEQFNVQDYDPAINLSGAGSDDFDFAFNRVGFLMGGNLDLDLSAPVADFDASGAVDGQDFARWSDALGENGSADADLDGDSDGDDFLFWQQNVGDALGSIVLRNVIVTEGMAAANAVPEPATLLLTAIVGVLSARFSRRRE